MRFLHKGVPTDIWSKHRAEMADRNRHCTVEHRVKSLYQNWLRHIVKELEKNSCVKDLVKSAKNQSKS